MADIEKSNTNLTLQTSTSQQAISISQPYNNPLYKPANVTASSGSAAPLPQTIQRALTPAEIVLLDHNYSIFVAPEANVLQVQTLQPLPKAGIIGPTTSDHVVKPEKPVVKEKPPKPPKKEKAKKVKPIEYFRTKQAKYIFYTKPSRTSKNVSPQKESSIYLSDVKSSVFPASPSMSKLEHLLKSPSRSASTRRSPSSFLSPSLNYHRSKSLATGVTLSVPSPLQLQKEVVAEVEEEIDVEKPEPDATILYDLNKAKHLMKECEKYVNFLRLNDVPEDWEEQIVKTGWTNAQKNIYEGVLNALHNERLSRLAYQDNLAEPVLRRTSIDCTAQKFRKVLAHHKWDPRLTQWLHGVLVDNLSFDYLSAYLDVLQTLRAKLPDLVDKMIILSTGPANEPLSPILLQNSEGDHSGGSSGLPSNVIEETIKKNINAEALGLVLKRKWDPFNSVIQHNKTKKLPSSPIFVMISGTPPKAHTFSHKRIKSFSTLLAGRGKVVSVSLNMTHNSNLKIRQYVDKLFKVATEKIRDLKKQFSQRPVFLVGWGSGSLLACQISIIEQVAGVVALAFPLVGPTFATYSTDSLDQMKCPLMFVIGEHSTFSRVVDLELYRDGLSCETSLLVVGTANSNLNITFQNKKQHLVTQSYVDKVIADEITTFVSSCPTPVSEDKNSTDVTHPLLVPKGKRKPKANKSLLPLGAVHAEVGPEIKVEEMSGDTCVVASTERLVPDITDFDFDGPKMIPSNTSSNKRKAYYRPAPAADQSNEKITTSPTYITASQLVQQNPGVKRFSKPSGPNKPKPPVTPNSQTLPAVNSTFISNDHVMQIQRQPSLTSVTINQHKESVSNNSKPLVFNFVKAPTNQVLNIKREPESPEIKPAPTRFMFAVDESNPASVAPSDSLVSMVDSGLKQYMSQSCTAANTPVQDSSQLKGIKRANSIESAPGSFQKQRRQSKPTPSIITTPTVLPGGATAIPYIRTTHPVQPPPQKYTSHLFRLLSPSQDTTNRLASVTAAGASLPSTLNEKSVNLNAVPPTRKPHVEIKKDARVLPIIPGTPASTVLNSATSVEVGNTIQLKPSVAVPANPKPMSNVLPIVKIPRLEDTNAYVVANEEGTSSALIPVASASNCAPKIQEKQETGESKVVESIDDTPKIEIGKIYSLAGTLDFVLGTNAVKFTEEGFAKSVETTKENLTDNQGHPGTLVSVSKNILDAENVVAKVDVNVTCTTPIAVEVPESDVNALSDTTPENAGKKSTNNDKIENLVKPITTKEDLDETKKMIDNTDIPTCNSSSEKGTDLERFKECQSNDQKVCIESKQQTHKMPKVVPTPPSDPECSKISEEKTSEAVVDNPKCTKNSDETKSTKVTVSKKNCSGATDIKSKSSVLPSDRKTRNEASRKFGGVKSTPDTTIKSNIAETKKPGNAPKSTERLRSADRTPKSKNYKPEGTSRFPKRSTRESSVEQRKVNQKILTRSSSAVDTNSERTVENPEPVDIVTKANELVRSTMAAKSTEKEKKTPVTTSKEAESKILSLRKRSKASESASLPNTKRNSNPHVLRKKSRLVYKEESESDSCADHADEEKPVKKSLRASVTTKEKLERQRTLSDSTTTDSSESEESEGEIGPRVTRSMRRQSVTGDSGGNDSFTTSDDTEGDKTRHCSTVNEKGSELCDSSDIEGKVRERRSSGSITESSDDDEDSEGRKRVKPIHPVTPASLSVTRTRKISIPNYFAYGM